MVLIVPLKTENNAVLLKKNLRRKPPLIGAKKISVPAYFYIMNLQQPKKKLTPSIEVLDVATILACRRFFFHDHQSENSFNSFEQNSIQH